MVTNSSPSSRRRANSSPSRRANSSPSRRANSSPSRRANSSQPRRSTSLQAQLDGFSGLVVFSADFCPACTRAKEMIKGIKPALVVTLLGKNGWEDTIHSTDELTLANIPNEVKPRNSFPHIYVRIDTQKKPKWIKFKGEMSAQTLSRFVNDQLNS